MPPGRSRERLGECARRATRGAPYGRLPSVVAPAVTLPTLLPEIEAADTLAARVTQLADDVVLVETEDSDLGREQSKLEADIDLVRSRQLKDQQRLDAGQVSSPRELENLQSEIESLKKRQGDLEDEELEIMERREVVQKRLQELRDEREQLIATLGSTEQRRDATFAEIDAETEKTGQQRAELSAAMPDE